MRPIPMFYVSPKMANYSTRSDLPAVGLQRKIKDKFTELKRIGELSLSSIKEAALVDFISTYPAIVSKACPTESIAQGFLLNGMIDDD